MNVYIWWENGSRGIEILGIYKNLIFAQKKMKEKDHEIHFQTVLEGDEIEREPKCCKLEYCDRYLVTVELENITDKIFIIEYNESGQGGDYHSNFKFHVCSSFEGALETSYGLYEFFCECPSGTDEDEDCPSGTDEDEDCPSGTDEDEDCSLVCGQLSQDEETKKEDLIKELRTNKIICFTSTPYEASICIQEEKIEKQRKKKISKTL